MALRTRNGGSQTPDYWLKLARNTQKEIVEKLNITDGGRLSRNLNALISSDFVIKYVPFGFGKREEHYKLIDPFCIFYLHFIEGQKNSYFINCRD